ncbi:hypothetical protein JVT61DRAFT_11064 [Boletus reticuloceps]|uniref:Uncharacterized protein n=1 Tax=Boletus reticuloceps TaxID=495285 RepID=A0A8I3A4T5_9AGAM|nr:hypothetical protein JVT61DRAFT_11064 [Boletus reticuloceps]
MFSCHWELLNTFLGFVCVLFNSICFGGMHCDVGLNNLMLQVPALNEENTVPDWPENGWFKCGALLSDWGLGLKVCLQRTEVMVG